VQSEQISFVVLGDTLLTFQERPGDVFVHVRERLFGNLGRVRREGSSYLLYCLLDAIVDNTIEVMQVVADQIEAIEEALITNPDDTVLESILSQKKELFYLNKAIRPAKQAVRMLLKESAPLIASQLYPYFQDLLSNLTQVIESVDLYKEICSEYLENYNSYMNDKLNDTMKFLTVFSVIFLPLTLITGIYGTNFEYIPELHLKYGYLYLWGAMAVVTGIMIYIFKRKKWL